VTNVTLSSAGSATNAPVGSYAINIADALGVGLTNYTIGYSNGMLTVNAANLLITAADTNKVYGATFEPAHYTSAGLVNGDAITNVTLASAGSVSNATIGSYPIMASNVSGLGLTNYSVVYSNGTLTVNAMSLLIVAGSTNKVYGSDLQPTLYSVVGLTNGDSVTNVTLTSTGTPTNAAVGSYAVVPSSPMGSGLTNYSVTLSNGSLTVDPAGLLITALDTNKTFGETLVFGGTEFMAMGLQNGDQVTATDISSSGAAAGASAGVHPIAVTNAVGSGLANYAITYVAGSLTVILPPQDFSITSITAADGIATVTWQSVSNITYQLQYKTNLLQTNWTAVVPSIVASGPSASMTNAVDADEQRYYRVQATW
jgi:hypothetical protein